MTPAPIEQRPSRPLSPSSLGDDVVSDPPPGPGAQAAAERGRLIHALFERLPPVSPDDRARAAHRWLAQAGGLDDAAQRQAIVADVLGVVDDPRFADLFGPHALAEAPITATLGDGLVVSGTVDRLLVTDDVVRVIDFKTGRHVPATLDDIPPYHRAQMAAYAAALAVIFPGRRIEAGLLYSSGPRLHLLPAAMLARDKPGYATMEQS